jgi:hypothetical protein
LELIWAEKRYLYLLTAQTRTIIEFNIGQKSTGNLKVVHIIVIKRLNIGRNMVRILVELIDNRQSADQDVLLTHLNYVHKNIST